MGYQLVSAQHFLQMESKYKSECSEYNCATVYIISPNVFFRRIAIGCGGIVSIWEVEHRAQLKSFQITNGTVKLYLWLLGQDCNSTCHSDSPILLQMHSSLASVTHQMESTSQLD